jgi:hypothetical protein
MPENTVLIASLAAVVVLMSVIAIVWLPGLQVRRLKWSQLIDPEARFDKENEARKTIAQVIAGLAFFGGLYQAVVTVRNGQIQMAISQDGQITERFTKAIELLGSGNDDKATGAVYALERIAEDSNRLSPSNAALQEDYRRVIGVLTLYVRTHYRCSPAKDDCKARDSYLVPSDLQAALTVVGNLNRWYQRPTDRFPDLCYTALSGLDLRGLDLHELVLDNTDFRDAVLDGANLSRTILTNSDFRGTDLRGVTGLSQAQVDDVYGDPDTCLPSGLKRPKGFGQESQECKQ